MFGMAAVPKIPKKTFLEEERRRRESSQARGWTGNQSYVVQYQAGVLRCINDRAAILSIDES